MQIVKLLQDETVLAGDVKLPKEGSLLPETYKVERGMTRAALIAKMQVRKNCADELWPQRQKNLPFKTKREALILASIVERETGVASERPLVAAVFVNRLRKGMRLQSDPTIIYGLVGGKESWVARYGAAKFAAKRPNTYRLTACRRHRLPIRGAPRLPPCSIRRIAKRFILWPTARRPCFR